MSRHLDPHPFNALVELLPRNGLVMIEVEEKEGLGHHLELLFNLVRDQSQQLLNVGFFGFFFELLEQLFSRQGCVSLV